LAIFNLLPLYGITLAFKDFSFAGGLFSPWNGLDNFRRLFRFESGTSRVLLNTIVLGFLRSILLIAVPLVFTLILDMLPGRRLKFGIIIFLLFPHLLSWVVVAGVFRKIFAIEGPANTFIAMVFRFPGPVRFFSQEGPFYLVLFSSILWRDLGFYAILYYSALAEVDPALHEAAFLDGVAAWSLKSIFFIKLPCIKYEIYLVASLVLISFSSGIFEPVFNLYNPALYHVVDTVDTYVYRTGIAAGRFSLAAAIDLLKSIFNLVPSAAFFVLIYRRMVST
jgi:putative aldouronate transport system permease protein